MSDVSYDTAQICKNGHSINSSFHAYPFFNKNFCDRCGEQTITRCENCNTEIRGHLHGSMLLSPYEAPQYCENCGKPFIWTERRLEAARDYSNEFEELNTEEKEKLQASIQDLVKQSPNTPIAQKRFKTIMSKVGTESFEGMKTILTDVLSEAVKKSIFGP